jgi:serine/threonine protein kinase
MASVEHDFCLQLTALCIAEPMMLVSKFMPYGSVESFYKKYREKVSAKMLLTWSMQIAEGMCYLESKGIVHRDLAARNILVKSFHQVKITDYGLAKVLDQNENCFYAKTNTLLPVKWLAIESIKQRLFTHKSDVWSYGVCLWEMFTFCAKPYNEIDNTNLISCLQNGVRLAKPNIASLEVYTTLLKCWVENPAARPTFKELSGEFSKMCQNSNSYLAIVVYFILFYLFSIFIFNLAIVLY